MSLSPGTFPKPHAVRIELFSRKLFRNSSSPTVMLAKHFQMNSDQISVDSSTASVLRVAYQGVPGANSEAAALKAHPDSKTVPFAKFEDAIKAAEIGLVDEAVIPIENTIGGSIHFNYDMLLRHRVHIVGETHLIVNHCLLALPGVAVEELNSVFSHPQIS
ncbi:UNVERIFIED_CONTAM: Arogenate dehydratase/prephenate dehydratase 1, chloroplastic [Sesamum radiatum]|uniref:Arogenate dehydratase/prephenate dehydratase 1, chloroplastic n=1 Tax=Sesamum radiatum TaxID=300843 RepID=A0AAW2QFU8_SESRA